MMTTFYALDAKLKRLAIGERFIRRNPLYYGPVQRELALLEAADLPRREVWVHARLRKILSAATRTPYGRRIGAGDSLHRWPLLDKESVRASPRDFQSGLSWFKARADTGGTTGMPLKLVRSPQSVGVEQVCLDETIRALGIDPRSARVAVLRGDSIKAMSDTKPPFWIHALGGRRLIMASNHLSDRTLRHYVDALRTFAPDLLWVYPTTLEMLCLLLQRSGEQLQMPRVVSSSEMLRPDTWHFARSILGSQIADRYGQAERVALAHAFAPYSYRFVPGYSYVELLPTSEDGSIRTYEIVGTSLWNTAMPLVRYRTGDLVRLPSAYGERELQEIAMGIRPFDGVIGRSNDILLAPDGEGVLTGIDHIQRGVDNLVRLQVVQETSTRIVLRALATGAFCSEDARKLMSNARAKIPESADVRLELVSSLARTRLGKTPFVVHSPEVQERLRGIGLRMSAH